MKKIENINKFTYGILVILLLNSSFAVLEGIWNTVQNDCNESCLTFSTFLIIWGSVGIVSGVFIFKKYIFALWGGSLFFLLQALGISTSEFSFHLNYGLNLFVSVGSQQLIIFINILAIIAVIILISAFVSEYQKYDNI